VDDDGVRWFRTSDIGRRDAAGRLHLAGRKDRQVLVNGHRLALDEIELLARTLPGVADAVAAPVAAAATALAGGGAGAEAASSLRLWVLPAPGARLDGAQVRQALRQMLPDAAVPARSWWRTGFRRREPEAPCRRHGAGAQATPDQRLRQIAEALLGGPFDRRRFSSGSDSLSVPAQAQR
jgi:acyl-CoA synthetase (AMP-forming)/AMP-acid ligase II